MTRKEKKDSLKDIKKCFEFLQAPCNPIDFMSRQADLLNMMGYHFLRELNEMEEEDGERSFD